jgi:hypothetical protein
MECVRCHELLDTDLPPAIDFRSGQLVCPECHGAEKSWRSNPTFEEPVRMATVPNQEVW